MFSTEEVWIGSKDRCWAKPGNTRYPKEPRQEGILGILWIRNRCISFGFAPVSLFTSYSLPTVSPCALLASAGLSMLVFFRALLMGLDNLYHPRAKGTRSVQAPDEYIQLPSGWFLLGYPTHKSVKCRIIKIIPVVFPPPNLLLLLCLGKWHQSSGCYSGSSLEGDLDFALFPLLAHSINH